MPLVLVLVSAALLGAGALLAVAITSIGGGVDQNAATLRRIEKEALARRDQTCVIFERQAHAAERRLRATYDYLGRLTPRQVRSPLNQAVIRGMSDTETDARTSVAPHYCDPRGVGLPDPPASLPKRRDFSRLLVPPGT